MSLTKSLTKLVNETIDRAINEHGPLPTDHTRATVILMEEVGEVSEAVLNIDRAARRMKGKRKEMREGVDLSCRAHAIGELLQVIAVSVLMIKNLDVEKELG
jgi:NTP pyrophosphatase (non-canonical NTP hydrolase)